MLTHEELKAKALSNPAVKAEYDKLKPEFALLDECLRARAAAGLTQSEVAKKIGTTQSAIARLESGNGVHSPSIATLTRYAQALGCIVQIKLIRNAQVAKQAAVRSARLRLAKV